MPRRSTRTQRKPFPVASGAAYVAGGQARLALEDIQPLPDSVNTYVRGIGLVADMLMTHDNGAPVNLPEELVYRIIDAINMRQPETGHVFFQLGAQAGYSLRCLDWARRGRRPNAQGGGGNISLTNGVNTAVRLKLYLPFQNVGGINPADFEVPLDQLKHTQLLVDWVNGAAGGAFDSGANNERIVSGTLRAYVDLVGRDEYREPSYFSITSFETGSSDGRLPISNEVLHWLIETPVHAAGITVNRITDAERDLYTVVNGGDLPVDRMDSRDCAEAWNEIHATTRDAALPHQEANTAPWLPVFFPGQKPTKITYAELIETEPTLRVTGTDTTPHVVFVTSGLADRNARIAQLRRSGKTKSVPGFEKNPERFLTVKGAKGPAQGGKAGAQRLPVRLHSGPVID